MKKPVRVIPFEDIKPGMMLIAKSASGSRYRRVYKTIERDKFKSIWSIVHYWDGRNDEWVEECNMVCNTPDRITGLWEDGIEYRLEII